MEEGNNRNRETLLNLMKGGSGRVGDYIEVIHYAEPVGALAYIPHTSGGSDLELICSSEQTARALLAISARENDADGAAEAAEAAPIYDDGRTINGRSPYCRL